MQRTVGAFSLTALLLLMGCGSGKQNSPVTNVPPPVTVSVAGTQAVPLEISAIGNAQAYRTVQVKSMVDGQIDKVLFRQGQDVRAGEMLFGLDKKPFQAALNEALGKLGQDEATANNSRAQAARAAELLKGGVMAVQDAQTIEAQAKSNTATVQADKAAVETARVNLGYTEIQAPISSRTGAILVNLGNLVKANDTTALTTLNQITPIYVTFNIPESNLRSVRAKAAGQLKVEAFPPNEQNPETGTLTFIDNTVDTTTGTIKLMATFPNLQKRLWPGEYLNVRLILGVDLHAVVVPSAAVQSGQDGKYVYVVQPDETAIARPVNTSRSYGQLAVIASGVTPGERVIVDGQIRVVPNKKVNVVRTNPLPQGREMPAPATQAANVSGAQE
ncbi:MAG TPA: efflux RND transporter periplasmic adaptor subunit [Terriglobales bacterium]